jgi:hypothetical protein
MDIEYLSDSESDDEVQPTIPVKPIHTELHQIINYPKLERHSVSKLIDICKSIDAIDHKLQGY